MQMNLFWLWENKELSAWIVVLLGFWPLPVYQNSDHEAISHEYLEIREKVLTFIADM